MATWVATGVALLLGVGAICRDHRQQRVAKVAARKMFGMPLAVMNKHADAAVQVLTGPALMGEFFPGGDPMWSAFDFYRCVYSPDFLASNVQHSLSLGKDHAALVAEVTGLCAVAQAHLNLVMQRKECWREDCGIALRCISDIKKALSVLDWLPSLSNEGLGGIDPERYYKPRA
ncbi:hypothetical protein [Comamonas antarctica]|uniref:hypothetical protein n=1 Tax=Comamonas antarctica TaxID=2743470 RepID=UPI0028E930E6|nr:hypothetical protein [Comamonas antarctica]